MGRSIGFWRRVWERWRSGNRLRKDWPKALKSKGLRVEPLESRELLNCSPWFNSMSIDMTGAASAWSRGQSVDSLFADSFSDTDMGSSLAGVALSSIMADTSQGTLEYSTNGGMSWNDVGPLSEDSALVLSSTSRLRVHPASDYSSGRIAGISVHAIDNTFMGGFSGSERITFDATLDDDMTSPVSSGTLYLSCHITGSLANNSPQFNSMGVQWTANSMTWSGGVSFDSLLGSSFYDPDMGSFAGVAVSSAMGSAVEYSTDAGMSWWSLGSLDSESPLMLAHNDRVRLNLNAGVSPGTAMLSVHAVDSTFGSPFTSGSSRSTCSLASNDNHGPLSPCPVSVSLSAEMTSTNHSPQFINTMGVEMTADSMSWYGGQTIDSLLANNFYDPDMGDSFLGVALSSSMVNTSQGFLEYSTDGGMCWYDMGMLSGSDALVLGRYDRVRIHPMSSDSGWVGSLSMHAIDSTYNGSFTSGGMRVTFDTTSDSDTSSPVSTWGAYFSASYTGVPSNHSPSFNTMGVELTADSRSWQSGRTFASLFGDFFYDQDMGDSFLGVALSSSMVNTSQGSLEYSTDDGANWYDVGMLSDSNALVLGRDDRVRFDPKQTTPNPGWVVGSLSVHAVDSTYSGSFTSGGMRVTFDTTSDSDISSPVSSWGTYLSVSWAATSSNHSPWFNAMSVDMTADSMSWQNGRTFDSLFGDFFYDQDMGDSFHGVALSSSMLNTSQGLLEYSTDGGVMWYNAGMLSDSNALVLGRYDRVRIQPISSDPGWVGGLSVHAIDSNYIGSFTSGGMRVTFDTTSDSDTSSPVSSWGTYLSASFAGAPSNHSPSFSTMEVDMTANPMDWSAGLTIDALFARYFQDQDMEDSFAGVALSSSSMAASAKGEFEYCTAGDSTWYNIGMLSENHALVLRHSDRLRVKPDAETEFGPVGSLTVHALDSTYSGLFTAGGTRRTFDTAADNDIYSPASEVGIDLIASYADSETNHSPWFDAMQVTMTVDCAQLAPHGTPPRRIRGRSLSSTEKAEL
jgi:hypothetical protein